MKNTNGDAVVEATVLFPIMIMVFAALVLLSVYLPVRAALQRATQYAATALATERSDTWLFFDENSMKYFWEDDKHSLTNVYAALFNRSVGMQSRGEEIVVKIEDQNVSLKSGDLSVECYPVNRLVYNEVIVTATREFTLPINLSIIGFPAKIPVTATSTAVVQNPDEFIRSLDMGVDFAEYVMEKFGLTDISESISSFGGKVASFLGWS